MDERAWLAERFEGMCQDSELPVGESPSAKYPWRECAWRRPGTGRERERCAGWPGARLPEVYARTDRPDAAFTEAEAEADAAGAEGDVSRLVAEWAAARQAVAGGVAGRAVRP